MTLWALVSALGATVGWPPFASTLAIEVYPPRGDGGGGSGGTRGASVRVVYNGEPLAWACAPRGGASTAPPVGCLTAILSATALSADAAAAACARQPPRARNATERGGGGGEAGVTAP